MGRLSTDSFERPADLGDVDDPRVLYARSYLLIRLVVGFIGVLLPTLLFALDGFFLRGGWLVRGSLSAYYHSGARDLFVGALCVTGFLLITYMAGQRATWDFVLSSTAGIAALGVAFLPTTRPNLADDAPLCGSDPIPAGCTQLQQAFGEMAVATIHYISAAIFILSLAAICFVFATREQKHVGSRKQARFHRTCGVLILAAVAWVALGRLVSVEPFGLTPLYVGEVVSVYAFGASWISKGRDLLKRILGVFLPLPRTTSS
ncbi:MAG: hypothetical protein ACRDKT_12455 [Actinomycetota bacterium]